MSDVFTSGIAGSAGNPYGADPFAAVGSIMTGTAALANAGTNIGVAVKNGQIADKNYELQQGWYEYQKALQQQIFDREDTAVQRRLADLTKAGFSPLAAVGQSANAGQAVSTTPPQHSGYQSPDLTPIIQAAQVTDAIQTSAINRQNAAQQLEANAYNFKWYKDRGLPLDSSMTERLIGEALLTLGTNMNQLPEQIQKKFFEVLERISDKGAQVIDDIKPAVVDTEVLADHQKEVEDKAYMHAYEEPKGDVPKIDYSGIKRYKDQLKTWKAAYNDMLYMYGDPAYYDYLQQWLEANPKPKRK